MWYKVNVQLPPWFSGFSDEPLVASLPKLVSNLTFSSSVNSNSLEKMVSERKLSPVSKGGF